MKRLNLQVDLMKLKHATLTNIKGRAATKRCLVIPVDDADLYVGKKGIYLSMVGYPNERDGESRHLLKQSFGKEFYEAMSEEERRAAPILGDIVEWIPEEMKASNTVDMSETDESDDLPF